MTQQERAKLFMPFDAMKGLKEALRKREEKHLRVQKIELSEESLEELSSTLLRLEVGTDVMIKYYCNYQYVCTKGIIRKINYEYRLLFIDDLKIHFDDIYSVEMIL